MAGKLNLTINQGETFTHILKWSDENNTPVNLTGYTAKLQIREKPEAVNPLIELSTENGGIIFSLVEVGTFTLTISSTATTAITWNTGVYDLLMIAPDLTVTRLIEGRVTVSKGVTR